MHKEWAGRTWRPAAPKDCERPCSDFVLWNLLLRCNQMWNVLEIIRSRVFLLLTFSFIIRVHPMWHLCKGSFSFQSFALIAQLHSQDVLKLYLRQGWCRYNISHSFLPVVLRRYFILKGTNSLNTINEWIKSDEPWMRHKKGQLVGVLTSVVSSRLNNFYRFHDKPSSIIPGWTRTVLGCLGLLFWARGICEKEDLQWLQWNHQINFNSTSPVIFHHLLPHYQLVVADLNNQPVCKMMLVPDIRTFLCYIW